MIREVHVFICIPKVLGALHAAGSQESMPAATTSSFARLGITLPICMRMPISEAGNRVLAVSLAIGNCGTACGLESQDLLVFLHERAEYRLCIGSERHTGQDSAQRARLHFIVGQRNVNRAINQRVCKSTLISAAETTVSAAEAAVSAAETAVSAAETVVSAAERWFTDPLIYSPVYVPLRNRPKMIQNGSKTI